MHANEPELKDARLYVSDPYNSEGQEKLDYGVTMVGKEVLLFACAGLQSDSGKNLSLSGVPIQQGNDPPSPCGALEGTSETRNHSLN